MGKEFFVKKIGIFSMILFCFAALCVIYFVMVASYTGLSSKFHFVWLGIAAILVILGILFSLHHRYVIHIPNAVLIAIGVVFIVAAIALGTAEGLIISNGHAIPSPGADYMIVLGTQVKGTRITLPLKYRLDAALAYADDNPDTLIIVTGGRGYGEDITEAEAMKTYLMGHNIAESRIICEEQAADTEENIRFSMALMDDPEHNKTVIVTNAFHIYRSLEICRKQGMEKAEGLGAKSNRIMIPSFYLREGIAVLKYKVTGQI